MKTNPRSSSRRIPRASVVALISATLVAGCHGSSAPRDPSEESAHRDDSVQEMHEAAVVLREVLAMSDGVPVDIRRDARCVAVIPSLVKAAFVVGVRYGRGVASCRTATSWSAPAFFNVGGGSFGLQIGAQSTDLVLYVMNENGMRKLLHDKLELGAEASVAAGPVGREATAGTDWKLKAELLAYSRSRGLFAGIDLGGSVLVQDKERERGVYGADVDYRALLEGRVPSPAAASELIGALKQSDAPRGPAVSAR